MAAPRSAASTQPQLQRLAVQAANDQAGVHQLYLQQGPLGLNVTIDGDAALFLSLHRCDHHRRKTKFCHYGVEHDPLPHVHFDGAALTYRHRDEDGRTLRETRPMLVHANGDHSRLDLVWRRAMNASAEWRAAPSALRGHEVMVVDADEAAGGACSLSSVGALSDAAPAERSPT